MKRPVTCKHNRTLTLWAAVIGSTILHLLFLSLPFSTPSYENRIVSQSFSVVIAKPIAAIAQNREHSSKEPSETEMHKTITPPSESDRTHTESPTHTTPHLSAPKTAKQPEKRPAGRFLSDNHTLTLPTPKSNNQPPRYPRLARQKNQEGTVVLEIDVTQTGGVANVRIKESSGHSILDQAAKKTVSNWHFQPAMRGVHTALSTVLIPIQFRLHNP